ncbi:ATP-binding cassette, subfamily C, exporter for protease/lipase [Lampropedia hyalina DSM 16112]|jgi:ATP-binding cassette subfamily C exporter for protease/lipase|uniref:ATP-binding cassette, subfamily C, exporter for protease/lipase n=1 Tax=Lampropedia hyalina DSM 16112 TaxID=1122156 RepID=A0A1M4W0D9_9BURK|nr:type I secretion system permease/ATPase [Lampropedia hyalina]SHE74764.1 ATP-binding cassette, subfamily C, exporter for protease/lipase [Lampropedia hyalina DSM 16112]
MSRVFNRPGRNPVAGVLRSFRSVFVSVGLFSAVINVLMLVPAIYMLQVYDRVLPSGNEMTLLMLTLILLGLYGLMGLLEYLRGMLLIRSGSRLDLQLNGAVHSATFEANLRGGALQASQTLGDLTTLRQFLTGNALFAFFDVPWFPIYLAVIFLFHPWLGVLALAGALVLVVLAWLNERVSGPLLAEAGVLHIQSGAVASAHLRNAEVIAALGMLPALFERWLSLHLRFLQRQQTASERAAVIASMTRVARLSLQSLILGLGALLAVEGKITPGMMIAASILMGRTLAPIEQVIGVWKQWSTARLAWGRLDQLLAAHPQRDAGMSLPRPTGELVLEAVAAIAPGTRPGQPARAVFSQLNLKLEPGQVLAVVGPSGAGKSTLARLLVGVAAPAAGHVRLDGADVYQWDKAQLGPAIGYLPQDVELFAGSLSENIARFGAVDADRVVAAAKLAGVHELILHLPQGYDTLLGEGGAGLSGGQRQRVGLARALYGEPVFVVLDEPNASLDEAGEAALERAIAALKAAGTTVVLMTHRQGLLAQSDRLLVLRPGQPSAFGPTDKVLAALRNAAAGSLGGGQAIAHRDKGMAAEPAAGDGPAMYQSSLAYRLKPGTADHAATAGSQQESIQ